MSAWIQRREGATSLLTLRRPPINALDLEALNELAEAVEKVEADRETRVLVITSGIEGIFCSGGDLNFWRQVCDGKEVSQAGRKVFARIERLPKPTIAAIRGVIENPESKEIQPEGRIRFWAKAEELGNKYLRVVTLADGVTIHNAFIDRGFKPKGGNRP